MALDSQNGLVLWGELTFQLRNLRGRVSDFPRTIPSQTGDIFCLFAVLGLKPMTS